VTGAPAPDSRPADSPPHRPYTARWGPLSISLDEATLTALARRLIDAIPELDDLTVHAATEELSVTIVVRRFGVPLSARASLSQIRFKDGFLALVLDSVAALSFIPIPDAVLRYLVEKAPPGLLTYDKADRILVVNANDWMPPGLDLTLDRAEIGRGEVTLKFSAGQFDLGRFLG
jgi:hypothetical protein